MNIFISIIISLFFTYISMYLIALNLEGSFNEYFKVISKNEDLLILNIFGILMYFLIYLVGCAAIYNTFIK